MTFNNRPTEVLRDDLVRTRSNLGRLNDVVRDHADRLTGYLRTLTTPDDIAAIIGDPDFFIFLTRQTQMERDRLERRTEMLLAELEDRHVVA